VVLNNAGPDPVQHPGRDPTTCSSTASASGLFYAADRSSRRLVSASKLWVQ